MPVVEDNARVESKVRLGELKSQLHQPMVPADQMIDVLSPVDHDVCKLLVRPGAQQQLFWDGKVEDVAFIFSLRLSKLNSSHSVTEPGKSGHFARVWFFVAVVVQGTSGFCWLRMCRNVAYTLASHIGKTQGPLESEGPYTAERDESREEDGHISAVACCCFVLKHVEGCFDERVRPFPYAIALRHSDERVNTVYSPRPVNVTLMLAR